MSLAIQSDSPNCNSETAEDAEEQQNSRNNSFLSFFLSFFLSSLWLKEMELRVVREFPGMHSLVEHSKEIAVARKVFHEKRRLNGRLKTAQQTATTSAAVLGA